MEQHLSLLLWRLIEVEVETEAEIEIEFELEKGSFL